MIWNRIAYIIFVFSLFLTNLQTIKANDAPTQKSKDSIIGLLNFASEQDFFRLAEAITAANSATIIAERIKDNPLLFRAYCIKGSILEHNNHYVEAASAYHEALKMKDVVADSSKLSIFIDWAVVHKKMGNYGVALEYYGYALNLANKQPNAQHIVATTLSGLGSVHRELGDFDQAISYYQQAIVKAEQEQLKGDMSELYRNNALVYLRSNNYDLALKNAHFSYNLAKELNDSMLIAGSLEMLSNIYLAKKENDLALQKILEALAIVEKGESKRTTLDVLFQTADVYVQLGELEKAEFYYKHCLDYKVFFDYEIQPTFHYKLGVLYVKKHQNLEAISCFRRSLTLATEGGLKNLIQKNNLALASIYEGQHDFGNAYHCLNIARLYADSLFNEEKQRDITKSQFIFDAGRSEQKYKDLQLKQGRIRLYVTVLLFSIVIVSLVYFLFQRGKNNEALRIKNDEIKSQNRRLEESNEILKQFAYASAHDLKEPLRSISSFTNIINRRYVSLLPPEATEYMGFVMAGVKRMESLLSALLEYSTIIVDNSIVTESTLMRDVLDEVMDKLDSTIQTKNARITYPPVDCAIRMNRSHLVQLFQNLVGNALKFSTKSPEIDISYQAHNDIYMVAIRDNGIGMNPDYGDKIFRLFQRLSRAPEYDGAGIGLTICKNIVEKYGGKIWFSSKENEGTTFYIALPLILVEPVVLPIAKTKKEMIVG